MSTAPKTALRAALALVAAFSASMLPAAAAGAADARFEAASLDGSVVFFSTDGAPQLLGDTDLKTDIYMRSYDDSSEVEDFVTRKVSTGPSGGNNAIDSIFAGASEDGSRAFFTTRESLVKGDTDRAADIYMRDLDESKTMLLSRGDPSCAVPDCGNAEIGASLVQRGVTPDGSRVFFVTSEALSGDDTDSAADIYVRDVDAEATTLVSQGDPSCGAGGCGEDDVPVLGFEDASDDGNLVVFRTEENLTGATDDGGLADLYQRDLLTGTTRLVSLSGSCPSCLATYGASSGDGSHVVFETRDAIDPQDTDTSQDVYDWSAGAVELVSIGPNGGNGALDAHFPREEIERPPGLSADGSRVIFETDESLVGADDDAVGDVYEHSGGVTSLVSKRDPGCDPSGCGGIELPASFRWISPDGSGDAALFTTLEKLSTDDQDASLDVYRRAGGTTTLVSGGAFGGDGEINAGFSRASNDGSHVFVSTAEVLDPTDEDTSSDIYDLFEGGATLVSTGPAGGNGPFSSGLEDVSADGGHAFFATDERLTLDDNDGEERDVYQRTATGTLLVSTGNLVQFGPAAPSQLTTDPPSPGASTTPRIIGQADAGSSVQVYTNSACSGEPIGSGESAELEGEGLQVTVDPGSTTSFWLSAESEGITSPCAGPLTYKHSTGGQDPGGESGGGSGRPGKAPAGGGGRGDATAGGIKFVIPESRITFGPSFKTRRTRIVFRFTDETGQPFTRFICRLDRRRWHRCRSPKRLRRLGRGRHVFRVKAVNALGQWEARPTVRRFKVVRRG